MTVSIRDVKFAIPSWEGETRGLQIFLEGLVFPSEVFKSVSLLPLYVKFLVRLRLPYFRGVRLRITPDCAGNEG